MTERISNQLREKDLAVLNAIERGATDTRQIREETTLSNRDVNYCLDKLEDLDLVETETPDGRVTAFVDGQKRNFKAPRQATLTARAEDFIQGIEDDPTRYRDMSHRDLVERVNELEQEIDAVKDSLTLFRQQVLQKLE